MFRSVYQFTRRSKLLKLDMAQQQQQQQQKRKWKWNEEETAALLRIWGEPDIRDRVSLPSYIKKKLWSEIAVLLHDAGYPARSAEQIHII